MKGLVVGSSCLKIKTAIACLTHTGLLIYFVNFHLNRLQRFRFPIDVVIAIILAYLTGFLIVLVTVGPWEAARSFAAEGLILLCWFWIAHHLLRHLPVAIQLIKRPTIELVVGLAGLALSLALATAYYLGAEQARWGVLLFVYGIPIVVFIALGYGVQAFGFSRPPRRGWAALVVIILVNFGAGIVLGQVLPPSELPPLPGTNLAENLDSALDVLLEIGRILVIAAIPEELFFRVYLQPRLAHYMPLRWAIVVQALLFSVVHLPQHLLSFGYSWPLALAGVLSINNGLIGGYLWSRTRSLPLLIVLHLFAYPRFGL